MPLSAQIRADTEFRPYKARLFFFRKRFLSFSGIKVVKVTKIAEMRTPLMIITRTVAKIKVKGKIKLRNPPVNYLLTNVFNRNILR